MQRRVIDVEGLGLACREVGDETGPTLVLLHGWPHSSLLYADVLEKFGQRLRVLAFDLPGVGDSRGSPVSAEKIHLADVILTAAEKAGGHSIVIAGLDVGGMIAFAAARDHATRIDADGRRVEDYANGLRAAGAEKLEHAVIRGSGEYLPVEAPDAFVERVRDFAERVQVAR